MVRASTGILWGLVADSHVFDQCNKGRSVWVVLQTFDDCRISALSMEVNNAILASMFGSHKMSGGNAAGVITPGLLLPSDAVRERLLRPTTPEAGLIDDDAVSAAGACGLVRF